MHRDRCHSSTLGCTPRRDNSCVLTEESHRLRDNLDIIIMLHGILTEGRVVLTMKSIEIFVYVRHSASVFFFLVSSRLLYVTCLLAVRPKFGSAFPAGSVL